MQVAGGTKNLIGLERTVYIFTTIKVHNNLVCKGGYKYWQKFENRIDLLFLFELAFCFYRKDTFMELDLKSFPLKTITMFKNLTGRLPTIKKQKQWNKGRNKFCNKKALSL